MHILFVDDCPASKVYPAIHYLRKKNIVFTYDLVRSVNGVKRYLSESFNEFDIAVVDLGLPITEELDGYHSLNGLTVIEKIVDRIRELENKNIPIIINSTTMIPNEKEYLAKYTDQNIFIIHVDFLDGNWLNDFINNLG